MSRAAKLSTATRGAVIIETVIMLSLVFVVFGATFDVLRAIDVKTAMNQAASIASQAGAIDPTIGTSGIQDLARAMLRESGQDDANYEIGVRVFNRVQTAINPTLFKQEMLQVAISIKAGAPISLRFLANPCVAAVMYFETNSGSLVNDIPDATCDPAAQIITNLGGTP